MRLTLAQTLATAATALLCAACSRTGAFDNGMPIHVVETKLSDTTIVHKSTGGALTVIADLAVVYPHPVAPDDSLTRTAQQLFIRHVLDQPDSLDIDRALRAVAANTLHQNDFDAGADAPDISDPAILEALDTDTVTDYRTSTTVSVLRHEVGLVTFQRVDVVKKNGDVTAVAHRYYTIDTRDGALVTTRRLFNDEAMPVLNRMLRERLLEQNNVTTNEQLNDLGFYNADNLFVGNNFFVSDKGVTWSFLPGELAVEAVGEPAITIGLEDLRSLLAPSSPLNRYY